MMNRTRRVFYVAVGVVALTLGLVGIFLPLLPTTPFLLLAAFCFSRGSARLHRWLLGHAYLGPPIHDWNERGVIRPRSKLISLLTMAVGLVSVWIYFPAHWTIAKFLLMTFMVSISIFIVTRPSK